MPNTIPIQTVAAYFAIFAAIIGATTWINVEIRNLSASIADLRSEARISMADLRSETRVNTTDLRGEMRVISARLSHLERPRAEVDEKQQ